MTGRGPDGPGGVHDEAATEPGVRAEERQRDDAGRGDAAERDDVGHGDHAGWSAQALMFGGIGVFMAVIGTIYWFMSYEWAGTTFLALSAAMSFLAAAYLGWPRRRRSVGDGAGHLEPGHDPHDGVWFPEASIWPFAVGMGMVLVGNGLLLGRWLLVPAGVFLLWALTGLVRQGRHRA